MRLCTIAAALAVIMAASGAKADAPADARAIIDKAIQALGGKDKLSKCKMQSWKAQGKIVMAGAEMPYAAEYAFAGPDKFCFSLAAFDLRAGTDGKVAWQAAMGQVEEMPKEKAAEFKHNVYCMHLSQLLPLLEPGYTLTVLGESKQGDNALIGIKVSRAGQRDVSMYFDKSTGLLAKHSSKSRDEFRDWKEVSQEVFMSDYRDAKGVKIFDTLTIKRDGADYIVEKMSDQKMHEMVEDKLFAKPDAKP